ncbi:MAG: hypothetical protein ACRD37_02520 [Candidatus Acidiferrales bacterium]
MPHTTVRSGSSQPNLIVNGAPNGSTLFIDGLQVGSATQYDGHPNVLAVLEGTHRVEIRLGESVVYSEKAFVGVGETHTVLVVGGTRQ